MIVTEVRAVESLSAQQRDLLAGFNRTLQSHRIAGLATLPDLSPPDAESGLAVYCVREEDGAEGTNRLVVAPRAPRIECGSEVELVAPQVLFAEAESGERVKLHCAREIRPFDWKAFWATPS